MKLTLGQAAKHASRAKGTLSKALNNGQMTGEKDDKGRWQIEPSELERWIEANPLQKPSEFDDTTPSETPANTNGNSALAVEVKMLREKMASDETKSEREREKLVDEIENLRAQLSEARQDFRQSLAVIEDMRPKEPEPKKRGFFARLVG